MVAPTSRKCAPQIKFVQAKKPTPTCPLTLKPSSLYKMRNGSTYATLGCFASVAAIGFFAFGFAEDCKWCYGVAAVCMMPLLGALCYAWCCYDLKYNTYPSSASAPKPKPTGRPKPSAPPAEPDQMPTAPPILELRQVVIQT